MKSTKRESFRTKILACKSEHNTNTNHDFYTKKLNSVGKIVIQPKFEDASEFSEGLAYVRVNGKYGFIDTAGNMVIEPQFDDAFSFSEGLASVRVKKQKESLWGYIDKSGKMVVKPQFVGIDDFHDGLARVEIELEL